MRWFCWFVLIPSNEQNTLQSKIHPGICERRMEQKWCCFFQVLSKIHTLSKNVSKWLDDKEKYILNAVQATIFIRSKSKDGGRQRTIYMVARNEPICMCAWVWVCACLNNLTAASMRRALDFEREKKKVCWAIRARPNAHIGQYWLLLRSYCL